MWCVVRQLPGRGTPLHQRVMPASGLFSRITAMYPIMAPEPKIFHNANDGIRCDAEYRGMCYALNENVCKNAPPSSLRRVHAYVCATIPIARHNKHGHLSRKESQNDRNHRTEVSCHGGTIRDEIREQLKYTRERHHPSRLPLLTCMSPHPGRAQPPCRLLVQDPGRHRERQHPRPSATCPQNS